MRNRIILFVCKGNSGRSQIAEAFFNHFCNTAKAMSAGIEPDEKIHPWTIKVMNEVQINMKKHTPKQLTEELMNRADRIIFLDSDISEKIPRKYLSKEENWQIEELLGKSIDQVREIRDEIKEKVLQLIEKL